MERRGYRLSRAALTRRNRGSHIPRVAWSRVPRPVSNLPPLSGLTRHSSRPPRGPSFAPSLSASALLSHESREGHY